MRAAVAADAVLNVGDPFLAMLGDYSCLLMLMASVAGVLLVIAAQVAGRAGGVVIAVEQEIAAVVECRGFPVRRLMTRRTCQRLAAMQIIARSHVTRLAVSARVGLQQGMIELHCTGLGQSRPRVIAVAGHTIGFGKRLMECRASFRLGDRHAPGGAQADIGDDMAGSAAISRRAPKRRMACKAIVLQRRMRRDQVPGADHFMRAGEAEGDDRRHHQRNTDPEGTLHFHPQNRKVERMWAVASTAKASAIGR